MGKLRLDLLLDHVRRGIIMNSGIYLACAGLPGNRSIAGEMILLHQF